MPISPSFKHTTLWPTYSPNMSISFRFSCLITWKHAECISSTSCNLREVLMWFLDGSSVNGSSYTRQLSWREVSCVLKVVYRVTEAGVDDFLFSTLQSCKKNKPKPHTSLIYIRLPMTSTYHCPLDKISLQARVSTSEVKSPKVKKANWMTEERKKKKKKRRALPPSGQLPCPSAEINLTLDQWLMS